MCNGFEILVQYSSCRRPYLKEKFKYGLNSTYAKKALILLSGIAAF